jgi:peptidase E
VATKHILATSGGFVQDRRLNTVPGPLVVQALELSRSERPKLCYVGTATGDAVDRIAQVYAAFAGWSVDVSHLTLFSMPNVADVRGHILRQDVVYVGGGSVANLLTLWRLHGVDEVMREAWEAGVVLTGISAGSICWHVGGPTDSFGPKLSPAPAGLALVPYGNGVHYNTDEQRRPALRHMVAEGIVPRSYAADDGVGLHYVGTEFVEAVSDRPDVFAYQVERATPEGVEEQRIAPRLLR